MSGVEIAGLVLGCLPLLIQGAFNFSCTLCVVETVGKKRLHRKTPQQDASLA